ncbi:MAG: hypothetical protein JJE42_02735 [Burkholderiales bacterium]|nr:hypothetical protein [Burkholderiales bacterium]
MGKRFVRVSILIAAALELQCNTAPQGRVAPVAAAACVATANPAAAKVVFNTAFIAVSCEKIAFAGADVKPRHSILIRRNPALAGL